jgi:16S rRNA (guanine527-N7)-methyltransferase
MHLTLIDASRKKISFLKHVIHSLHLDGIEAYHVRAEHLPSQPFAKIGFDVVISRAFSALDRFVLMGLPVLRTKGMLIAMKGRQVEAEMQSLDQLRIHTLNADLICKDIFHIDLIQYTLPVLKARRSLMIMKYFQEEDRDRIENGKERRRAF